MAADEKEPERLDAPNQQVVREDQSGPSEVVEEKTTRRTTRRAPEKAPDQPPEPAPAPETSSEPKGG